MKAVKLSLLFLSLLILSNAQAQKKDKAPEYRYLTQDEKYQDCWPTISPDQKWVVFARKETSANSRWRLWIVDIEGKNARPLTPDTLQRQSTRPSWSPDGTQIAFRAEKPDSTGEIWSIRQDGTLLKPITFDKAANDFYPEWSKDGKWISILRSVDNKGKSVIARVEVKTGEVKTLTSGLYYDGKSSVSPDGKTIAFASDRTGSLAVWTISASEGETSAKQFTFRHGRAPSWSPDGKWIAFGGNENGLLTIFIQGVNEKEPSLIIPGGFHPTWSKDQRFLVVDTTPLGPGKGRIAVVSLDAPYKR